ncbi:hypothetical protein FACUT_13065 [Fusarium acutatum]|uniref:Uncharacterized protein n=1 Tax=Fusarium acutatum TaxID=78861 RepID=A0A8H4JCD6_9HYPO|nr:hypothetical protein FACUT_13065 [Fusarium acutatum]
MSFIKMKGSKLCLKSYDNNGVVNDVFFVQKDVPCPNLLGKLKQLNPKSNGDAKNQRSGDSTAKFKPLAWIQCSEWRRTRAVILSSWMLLLQFGFARDACTLASVLTYQAYLADLEWKEPYVLSLIIAAIRILLFTLGTFGSLCPMYHAVKAQMQYIRALINLELPPEQKTKDENSVPQELPASAPPSSVLRQTSPYLETTRESPYEREKRAMETAPERRTPTPALLLLPPKSDHTHSMTTAQQSTSEPGQRGPQTTAPHLSRSPPVGNAPPSYTDSTTNGTNDVSRQAASDALIRRLNAPAEARQRQRAFNSRSASSSTGRVPVGQALEENATKSSDFLAQPDDREYVHHEKGK